MIDPTKLGIIKPSLPQTPAYIDIANATGEITPPSSTSEIESISSIDSLTVSTQTRLQDVPIQEAFIRQVINPMIGEISSEAKINFTDTPETTLLIENDAKYNENTTVNFKYKIVFRENSEIKTPTYSSLSEVNEIILPAPDPVTHAWTPEKIRAMQHAFRRMTLPNPLLYERHLPQTGFKFAEYQQKAIAATICDLSEYPTALVNMATATGKSPVTLGIIDHILDERKTNGLKPVALVLVNNTLILGDHEDNLPKMFGGKYEGRTGQIYEGLDNYIDPNIEIIYATPSSLLADDRKRLNHLVRILEDSGRHLAILGHDETHHLPAAQPTEVHNFILATSKEKNWNTVISGFTATPKRSDDLSVFRYFRNRFCYRYTIGDGWYQGYLTPMIVCDGDRDINPSGISPIPHGTEIDNHYKKNRYSTDRHPHIFSRYLQHRERVLDKTTLIVSPDIQSARALAAYFNTPNKAGFEGVKPPNTIVLTGEEKAENKEWFNHAYYAWKKGKWPEDSPYSHRPIPEVVIGVDLFKEGIDAPRVNILMLQAYTESSLVLTQLVGRALRVGKFKPFAIVDDLSGVMRNIHILRHLTCQFERYDDPIDFDPTKEKEDKDRGISKDLLDEITACGIEFDGDMQHVIDAFAEDIPANLCYLWGNYLNTPEQDREILDAYIARRVGIASKDDEPSIAKVKLHEFINTFAGKLKEGLTLSEVQEYRNQFRPAFYTSSIYNDDDYKKDKIEEIPIADATDMVFRRISDLVIRSQEEELSKEKIYQVFNEFSPDKKALLKTRARNLKIVRRGVFGCTNQKAIIDKLIEDNKKLKFLPIPLESMLYSSQEDFDKNPDSLSEIYFAEGGTEKSVNEKILEASTGEKFHTRVNVIQKELQDMVVRTYASHPVLKAANISEEAFSLPHDQFVDMLTRNGLIKATKEQAPNFISRLKKYVESYESACISQSQSEIEVYRDAICQILENRDNLDFFNPENLSESRCLQLIEMSKKIDNAISRLPEETTKDKNIRELFNKVLEIAMIRINITPSGSCDFNSYLVFNTEKTYSISFDSTDGSQIGSNEIGIYKDKLQRNNLIIRCSEEIANYYKNSDDEKRNLILDSYISAMKEFIKENPDSTIFIPYDLQRSTLSRDLFQRIRMEHSDWSVVYPVSLTGSTGKVQTKFYFKDMAHSNIGFMTNEDRNTYKYFATEEPGSEGINAVLAMLYDYQTKNKRGFEVANEKLAKYEATSEDVSVYNFVESKLKLLEESTCNSSFHLGFLDMEKMINNVLSSFEINNPDKSISRENLDLACLSFAARGKIKRLNEVRAIVYKYQALKKSLKILERETPEEIKKAINNLANIIAENYDSANGLYWRFNPPELCEDYMKLLDAHNELLKREIDTSGKATELSSLKPEPSKKINFTEPYFTKSGGLVIFATSSGKTPLAKTRSLTLHWNPNCPDMQEKESIVFETTDLYSGNKGLIKTSGDKSCYSCKTCKVPPNMKQWEDYTRDFQKGRYRENIYKPEENS